MQDTWQGLSSYEAYIGRWSRQVARQFVKQLRVAPASVWLDIGCGSGALSAAIVEECDPARVFALDRSFEFVRQSLTRPAQGMIIRFLTGDAAYLPVRNQRVDAAVSGLVLNFVPEPVRAVSEMARSVRPGGSVATYVWDYAEGMQGIRLFWDAATALNAKVAELDEANRFPICAPAALQKVFRDAGLSDAQVSSITVPMHFRDFDDFWTPFLGGQGPAPTYVASLGDEERGALRERLRLLVPPSADGSIHLSAKAWVARGVV
jgi:SAM-dependent methyltransferase